MRKRFGVVLGLVATPTVFASACLPAYESHSASDGGGGPDGTTADAPVTEAGTDGPAKEAGGDASDASDARSDADASRDGAVADADGATCSNACVQAETRCGTSGVDTCQVQANGCTDWVSTESCGANQTCSVGDAGAACTCVATVCTQQGTTCQDAQNVDTCSVDAQGCLYVASTMMCASPKSCSGTAPTAGCSLTCTNSCTQGQTSCVSGGLATCALGSNGCLAYGTPAACPGTRQTCTGTAGAALCTCKADSVCSAVGNSCASTSVLANCAKDAQGCFFQSTTMNCMGGTSCTGGSCVCGGSTPNQCGSTCTNLSTDPQNCGSCGNACLGAAGGETCASSRCQPYSIASASTPFQIATDGVNVFYLATPSPSSSTTIASVPVGGGKVSGPFPAANAVTIATDAVDVYWGGTVPSFSTGFISLAPVGNVGTASSVVSNFTDPVEVIYADTSDGFLKFAVFCDGIFSFPLRTTAAMQSGQTSGSNGCAGSVAAGNFDTIYWANPTNVFYTTSTNGLTGLFATGHTGALSSASGIQGIALQGSFVYYTDAAGGTVSRVPANGSAAPSAIALASSPRGLVVDASNVYWIDGAGASILRVPIAGGTTATMASAQSATTIAQDGSAVYWTNTNAVMRVPK